MKRRDFNQLVAGLTLETALGGLLSGCATSLIPIDKTSYSGPKGRLIATTAKSRGTCEVRVLDWDTYQFEEFEIPLDLVHSVVQDHADKHVLYFFEIFGSAAKVNLRTGSITKVDHKRDEALFNGHGALSVDNDFIACTEFAKNSGTTVRLRSTKDFSVIDELPVALRSCHQVIALPNSTILASGQNYGAGGALTFYDYRKKEIVGQFKTPSMVVHLAPLSATEAVATCMDYKDGFPGEHFKVLDQSMTSTANMLNFKSSLQPISAPLAYSDYTGKGRILIDEAKRDTFVVNYGLSKAPGGRFLSTHSMSKKVLVWKDFKIEHEIDVPEPKNVQISDDGQEFVVLADGKLRFYSMKTFELVKQIEGWRPIQTISSYT